jgi:hypothetical protein
MANTHDPLAPINFQPMAQDYLESFLVTNQIANTKFFVKDGKEIDWPYTTDMRSQVYTPGTDLDIDNNVAVSDTMTYDQSRAVTWTMDPNQQAEAKDKSVVASLAKRAGYITGKQIDQNVLGTSVTNAAGTVAGGTLSSSTIYKKLTEVQSTLDRAEGADGPLFAVCPPESVALLAQAERSDGFNVADSAIKNGFVGDSSAGFKIYKSNNLPTTVTLDIPTIPVAGDTFSLLGITFTWVAAGAAAAAGDIAIGANVAASQANFLLMIAGTATGSASTYIDVSVKNRRKMQNAVLAASAFASDVTTLTAYGRISGTENVTPADFVFGTETSSILCGRFGAPSLAMQIQPKLASAPLPNRPMEMNYALHTKYGRGVFERDKERLVDLTLNLV